MEQIKVNDILVATYCYSGVRNYFYKVKRMTDKSIWLAPLGKKTVQGDWMCGSEVADTSKEGRSKCYRIKYSNCVNVGKYLSNAVIWNGEPKSFCCD